MEIAPSVFFELPLVVAKDANSSVCRHPQSLPPVGYRRQARFRSLVRSEGAGRRNRHLALPGADPGGPQAPLARTGRRKETAGASLRKPPSSGATRGCRRIGARCSTRSIPSRWRWRSTRAKSGNARQNTRIGTFMFEASRPRCSLSQFATSFDQRQVELSFVLCTDTCPSSAETPSRRPLMCCWA